MLAWLIWADHSGRLLVDRPGDLRRYHGRQVAVRRVIDGDTLEIASPGSSSPTLRVRLWGLDTPERATGERPAEPWSSEASAMVRLLTLDGYVTLALEPSRTRDVFGRLLAHVRLPDGRDLGEVLLDSGLARGVERWPHRYLGRYARAEASARLEGRGRWATADADQ